MKGLHQDARVSCEASRRDRVAGGCEEKDPKGKGSARAGPRGRRDLRNERAEGYLYRPAEGQAGQGSTSRAPAGTDWEPASSDHPEGSHARGRL